MISHHLNVVVVVRSGILWAQERTGYGTRTESAMDFAEKFGAGGET